jgi:two-component system response regulator DegU
MTRVMIVGDEDFFRIGLHHSLAGESDLEVTDCGLDEQAVLASVAERTPQVILLCCDLANHWGHRLSQSIAQKCQDIRLVIISENQDDEELFRMVKTSAACLSRKTPERQLVETVRQASRHPTAEDGTAESRRPLEVAALAPYNIVVRLTNREREILQQVAQGHTNKEIGDELGISEQTIKCHVSAILRKLNANDRAHAVALGLRLCATPAG